MSKKTESNVQPLSENTKKAIIITAICVVAAVILAIALALILRPTPAVIDDNNTPQIKTPDTDSSTIKNGSFNYVSKDSYNNEYAVSEAQNWWKNTYKAADEGKDADDHTFENITGESTNVVMGIVDTHDESWSKVTDYLKSKLGENFANIANPSVHSESSAEEAYRNVYMIALGASEEEGAIKNAAITTASNASDGTYAPAQYTGSNSVTTSFTVSKFTYAKITVWLNTANITSGNATVVLASSGINAKKSNRLAYDLQIAQNVVSENNGWEAHEFYIFNPSEGTKSIYLAIGLGNVYDNTPATGALFIDDITYETISVNEYRKNINLISGDDVKKEMYAYSATAKTTQYLALDQTADTNTTVGVLSADTYLDEAKIDDESYSPFVNEATGFAIYRISNDGSALAGSEFALTAVVPANELTLSADVTGTEDNYLHLSFRIRVACNGNDRTAIASIVLLDGTEEIESSRYTSVVTERDIATDLNCGWAQYDYYIKPSDDGDKNVNIKISLGSRLTDGAPNGTLYVTSLAYETVSQSTYNSASSTNTKKITFTTTTASSNITNGTFSNTSTMPRNPGEVCEPENWIPVFAGDIAIFKDGITVADEDKVACTPDTIVGSGIVSTTYASHRYDDNKNPGALVIVNNGATSHGYLSDTFTLTANNVYCVSVLVKLGDVPGLPAMYLLDSNAKSRETAILASLVGEKQATANSTLLGKELEDSNEGAGWVRYYMIVVTGNETISARLALFNGKIDATKTDGGSLGQVYFDNANYESIGTYTLAASEDESATLKEVTTTPTTGLDALKDKKVEEGLTLADLLVEGTTPSENDNIAIYQPAQESSEDNKFAWDEIRKLDEAEPEEEQEEEEEVTPKAKSEVNVVLLISAISSILLVAALLIVVVIKIFRKRK